MIFTHDLNTALKGVLNSNRYSSAFVLVDKNTQKHCLSLLHKSVKQKISGTLTVNAGEITKNIDTCIFLWNELNKLGADRYSILINLGGGMISDLGGFIASTYKRGIHFINLPTTMLAMIDAAIGGKNGINLGRMKNQIGVINEPDELIIFPGFLETLGRNNYLAGYAEALKHGLIKSEKAFENTLEFATPDLKSEKFIEFLKENMSIKEEIVAIDPYEKADRKALNLGHTIGHALEAISHQKGKPMLHGEAVAWGTIAELFISQKLHALNGYYLEQMTALIQKHYPEPTFSLNDKEELLAIMRQDKKNFGETIRFTLLSAPGKYIVDQPVSENTILESLKHIKSLCQS